VDRLALLGEVATAVVDAAWTCLCFCLMTTHYHLILEVGEGTLPTGMKQVNTRYACRYNSRYRLRGHVFGGRYSSRRLATDAHLLAAFAYVARNPVEAGLCRSPAEWPWSSYAGTVGLGESQPFVDASRVVRSFGGTREIAIARLRAYVEGS
jgi:REP-associated tyrosine transposase